MSTWIRLATASTLFAFLVVCMLWSVRQSPSDSGATTSPDAAPSWPLPAPRPQPLPLNAPAPNTSSAFGFDPLLEYQFRRGDGYYSVVSVAIADIDGDRRNDLIGLGGNQEIYVWRQLADGMLADLQAYNFSGTASNDHEEMVVADFNNDNISDVVIAGVSHTVWGGINHSTMNMLLSAPNGALQKKQLSIEPLERVRQWQALDVDRDGNMDIVGVGTDYFPPGTHCGRDDAYDPTVCPMLAVVYGDGRGAFVRLERMLLGTPHPLRETETGDFDGDGLPDLLAVVFRSVPPPEIGYNDLVAFRQKYSGGLEAPQILYTVRGDVESVATAVGNLDRDDAHRADIATSGYESTLRVRTTGPNLTALDRYDPYTPSNYYTVRARSLLVTDIDGDRRQDAVLAQIAWVSNFGINRIGLYFQRDGRLQPGVFIDGPMPASTLNNRTLAIGDLNGDGCNDLAVAGSNYVLGLAYGRNCSQRRVSTGGPAGMATLAPVSRQMQRVSAIAQGMGNRRLAAPTSPTLHRPIQEPKHTH